MLPSNFLEPDDLPDDEEAPYTPGDPLDAGERWFDEDGRPIEYPDWTPGTSRVVSGPYGPASVTKFPGRRFPDRASARRYWGVRARILEEYKVPGRYIFRIQVK
jgi:hypothetical protein